MKLRTYGVVLSLFFALGLVFSFSVEASASHGDGTGIEAGAVDPMDKESVEEFLDHIIGYYNDVVATNMSDRDTLNRALVIFGRAIRQEGTYKNSGEGSKEMYSMSIDGSGILTNHAGHPGLFGYQFDPDAPNSAVASTIQTLIANSKVGTTDCQPYGDQNRVACAKKVRSGGGDLTIIAGLHHEADDGTFNLPAVCSEFMLADDKSPAHVYSDPSDANLKAYVQGIIKIVQGQVASATQQQIVEFTQAGGNILVLNPATPDTFDQAAFDEFNMGVQQKIYSRTACFGSKYFKHENIYAFIMDANPAASTVLFNGNNFDLNGTNLELNDDQLPGDDKSISGLFNRALGDPVNGAFAYVNYHWDDPTTEEDNVENFFRDSKVPGTSCKRSYIEVADISAETLGAPQQLYIFGSGTYHGDDVCASGDGGDDGCSIAGAGHTSQSALLNMFLIASVLFSVALLRRRV